MDFEGHSGFYRQAPLGELVAVQTGVHTAPRDSPAFEFFRKLIQDLHGLPVVVQLGIHQG